MKHIMKHLNNKNIDYFIIKEKVGHKYNDIVKYKNNIFNRLILSLKKFDDDKELYLVPEFNGFEGCYYCIG